MTDTPSDTVSLSKTDSVEPSVPDESGDRRSSGRTSRSASARGEGRSIVPPVTINVVSAVMAVMVVGYVLQALLLLGNTDMLKRYAIHSNANAKNPQDPFDAVHAVYTMRQSAFFTGALFGILIILLAVALRRTRSASASRWAVLVIFIYTTMPLSIIPSHGLPVPVQVVQVINGVSSIIVLALIFLPQQSREYFRSCREANAPEGAPARPGLASLFGPRPPRGGTADRTTGRTTGGPAGRATKPAQTRPDRAGTAPVETAAPGRPAGKARAKVRADSEAVAKGADLARSRAKASKSRRTVE